MGASELITFADAGSVGLLLIGIFLYIVVNVSFGPWFDMYERVRDRKIYHPQTFLSEADEVSPETQALLRDVSEARMLQRTIGIYAEHKVRGALHALHLETSHKIDLRTISLAWPHLESKDGKLQATRMSGWEKVLWLCNFAFAAFTLALLVVCLGAALYLFAAEPFGQAYLYATIFGLYAIALIFMLQAPGRVIRARSAARRIEKDPMRKPSISDSRSVSTRNVEGETDHSSSTEAQNKPVTRRLRGSIKPKSSSSGEDEEGHRRH